MWVGKKRFVVIGIMILVFFIQSCSIVFPIIAPFKDLPPPTGPYSVATRTTTWTDSSRDETFTPEQDFRRLVVQVWYPVDGKITGQPAPYVDDPKLRMPALARQLQLPVFPIKHFTKVRTNSLPDISPDHSGETFPVILFSHGLSGMRFQNTSLMEELASHGYIVIAPDHPYEANITIYPDGTTALYAGGKRRSVLRGEASSHIDFSLLSILVCDLSFLIDRVMAQQSDQWITDLPINPEQVGIIGHSLGGAAVINTAFEDDRVDAVMVLDGWYLPVPDSVIVSGIDQPYMHLGQEVWKDAENYVRMDSMLSSRKGPIFTLLVSNTKHPDYTDMPLFSPFSRFIGYTGTKHPLELNQLIRANSLEFFNIYLKDQDVEQLVKAMNASGVSNSYMFIPPDPKPALAE